jgi:branched-chain amino acid transport system permease protein
MVYGIIMLLNFAHGDIIMVGAYIAWIVLTVLGLPPVIGIVAAIAGCMLLGVTIEKVAYAPLRKSPRLSLLITAIGVSFFLENFVQLDFIMGAGAKAMPTIVSGPNLQFGGSNISFVPLSRS